MNLLFIYRRDIHEEDSGAARTIILRENYLVKQPDVKVFCTFRHLSSVDSRIIECPLEKLTAQNLHYLIRERSIDVLCVPEGEYLTYEARKAVQGTSCKIVSELHSKPGYALDSLISSVKSRTRYGTTFITRIKAVIQYLLFPLIKMREEKKSRVMSRNACLFSDKFVVLSPSYITSFSSLYSVSTDNMEAIGNPLSFRKCASKHELANKAKEILIVSRLEESQKRISMAIIVWSKIEKLYPEWNLKIVGSGNDEDMYRNLVAKLKLKHVSFEGWQSPEKYYENASMFLMTSSIEGWPMTVLEAQQKGCVPIVMDSFSAIHDIIESGYNGVIVNNGSVYEMANAVQDLISNPQKCYLMAKNAVESADRFSTEIIGHKWLSLYRSLL